jgi:DNA-binding transcriptional MerR regulator
MDLVSIGEFARVSRLSPKALRLYDELGLLPPARVDPDSGYRWYEAGQLQRARLVASLRQIDVPLAQINVILDLDPQAAAEQVASYWADVEAAHGARRELASYLVNRLHGKRSVMYEVATRELPARSLLCLKHHVDGSAGEWALGKEFVAIFRERPVPQMQGIIGAAFVIYHGEVNEDSDGPIEWCRPVPDDQAEALAASYPELTLRTEPAHHEAFIHLGNDQATPPRWQLVSETLHDWAAEHHPEPANLNLGVRMTFLDTPPITAQSLPDCDFAVPLG